MDRPKIAEARDQLRTLRQAYLWWNNHNVQRPDVDELARIFQTVVTMTYVLEGHDGTQRWIDSTIKRFKQDQIAERVADTINRSGILD